jgi:hypothetical protein
MPRPAALSKKLQKLIPLLGSDKAGEVVATAAAIGRTIKRAGYTWHDLTAQLTEQRVIYRDVARPTPARATWADLRGIASELEGYGDLSPWEADFVEGVRRTLRRGYPLLTKQRRVLERIWSRVGGGEEAA